MGDIIDARGLSCPMPVVLARKKIQELGAGSFEVLVDTDTSRENVSRIARHEGWEVVAVEEESGYRLTVSKTLEKGTDTA